MILTLLILLSTSSYLHAIEGFKYKWEKMRNGFYGYCYMYTPNDILMNNGEPVNNDKCGRDYKYKWEKTTNGYYGNCYMYTPNDILMNNGEPVDNDKCGRDYKYKWEKMRNGYSYCYMYTPNDILMNNGEPVDEIKCLQGNLDVTAFFKKVGKVINPENYVEIKDTNRQIIKEKVEYEDSGKKTSLGAVPI